MSEIEDMTDAAKALDESLAAELEPIPTSDLVVAESDTGYQQPWDRLPAETDYAWELFTHFRDTGVRRNFHITAVWAHDNGLGKHEKKTLTKYRQVITKYRERHRWSDRVFSYDKEQDRLYQMARSEAIREMAIRHEGQIEKAINGLMVPIDALTVAMSDNDEFMADLTNMDKKKLISLANLAARTIPSLMAAERLSRTIPSLMAAERLSRGMPTEIVTGVVEHQHVVSVERDQIGNVLEVLGQAGVLDVGYSDSGTGDIVDAEVVEVHSVPAESDD